jgi:hypothetical protein
MGFIFRPNNIEISLLSSPQIALQVHVTLVWFPNADCAVVIDLEIKNNFDDCVYPYDNSAMSSYYKVVVLGAIGVGKTSITQQFMTSEYVAFDNSIGKYLIQLYIPCTLP